MDVCKLGTLNFCRLYYYILLFVHSLHMVKDVKTEKLKHYDRLI